MFVNLVNNYKFGIPTERAFPPTLFCKQICHEFVKVSRDYVIIKNKLAVCIAHSERVIIE